MSSELPTQEEIITHDDGIPVPEWHLQILEERIARYGLHFPDGKPWEELRDELLQKIVEEIKRRKN